MEIKLPKNKIFAKITVNLLSFLRKIYIFGQ